MQFLSAQETVQFKLRCNPGRQTAVGNRQQPDEQRQFALAGVNAGDKTGLFNWVDHQQDRELLDVRLCTRPRINPARIIHTSWVVLLQPGLRLRAGQFLAFPSLICISRWSDSWKAAFLNGGGPNKLLA